jgi:hypothetical protein
MSFACSSQADHFVSQHPRNSVFGHRKATLSARFQPASAGEFFRPRITQMTRIQSTSSGEHKPLACCIRRLAECILRFEEHRRESSVDFTTPDENATSKKVRDGWQPSPTGLQRWQPVLPRLRSFLGLLAKPRRHKTFGAAGDDQFLGGGT